MIRPITIGFPRKIRVTLNRKTCQGHGRYMDVGNCYIASAIKKRIPHGVEIIVGSDYFLLCLGDYSARYKFYPIPSDTLSLVDEGIEMTFVATHVGS